VIVIITLKLKNGPKKKKLKKVKPSKELSYNSLWTQSVNYVNSSLKETKKVMKKFLNKLN